MLIALEIKMCFLSELAKFDKFLIDWLIAVNIKLQISNYWLKLQL